MKQLAGRVAVVPGGGSGIGRGLCRGFAAEGMAVAVADVDLGSAEETASGLRERGARAIAVHTDVSDRMCVEELASRVQSELGGAHVVCNNAGVGGGGSAWDAPVKGWEWTFGVNLWGVVHGIRTFVPLMIKGGESTMPSRIARITRPFAKQCSRQVRPTRRAAG